MMSSALALAAASALPPFSPNLVADVAELLRHDFMRHALLAGTATALVAGVVGYFMLLRRLVFAGDALSHPPLVGALGAALLGWHPLVGVFGLTIGTALGIGALGGRARARDVTVGTVLAWTLGLGVLLLSIYTATASAAGGSLGFNVLFGSILGISASDATVAALVAALVLAALVVLGRPLLFATLDPEVAQARGVPVRALGAAYLVLLAVTVGEATQVVGALLIFALLVTPAATAQRLTTRPFAGMALSAALALGVTWLGLLIGFYTPLPVSSLITILAFLLYAGVAAWQGLSARWHRSRGMLGIG